MAPLPLANHLPPDLGPLEDFEVGAAGWVDPKALQHDDTGLVIDPEANAVLWPVPPAFLRVERRADDYAVDRSHCREYQPTRAEAEDLPRARDLTPEIGD